MCALNGLLRANVQVSSFIPLTLNHAHRQHCSDILQYYRVLDLKPLMKVPENPKKYEKQVLKMSEDGEGIVGVRNFSIAESDNRPY